MVEEQQKRLTQKGFRIFCTLLIFCILLAVISAAGSNFLEQDSIAVLEITGTISENDGYTYDQQFLLDSIAEITADSQNKGLILHIDSPGGAVYQIDELYLALLNYKETTGRPVYAAIESYAASGGYYEACAADQIYANRNAIVGSIGVIMGEFVDVSDLLERLGVQVSYIASGPNKSMGNIYEPLTEEQKAIYQSICDEYYDRFVSIVAESRSLEEMKVRQLGDGRIYSASQALEYHMIDGIESFADTLQRMTTDLGYETISVKQYSYSAPVGFLDYLVSGQLLQQFSQIFGQAQPVKTNQLQHVPMMYCPF